METQEIRIGTVLKGKVQLFRKTVGSSQIILQRADGILAFRHGQSFLVIADCYGPDQGVGFPSKEPRNVVPGQIWRQIDFSLGSRRDWLLLFQA